MKKTFQIKVKSVRTGRVEWVEVLADDLMFAKALAKDAAKIKYGLAFGGKVEILEIEEWVETH